LKVISGSCVEAGMYGPVLGASADSTLADEGEAAGEEESDIKGEGRSEQREERDRCRAGGPDTAGRWHGHGG
jgi:hypothetical protein